MNKGIQTCMISNHTGTSVIACACPCRVTSNARPQNSPPWLTPRSPKTNIIPLHAGHCVKAVKIGTEIMPQRPPQKTSVCWVAGRTAGMAMFRRVEALYPKNQWDKTATMRPWNMDWGKCSPAPSSLDITSTSKLLELCSFSRMAAHITKYLPACNEGAKPWPTGTSRLSESCFSFRSRTKGLSSIWKYS